MNYTELKTILLKTLGEKGYTFNLIDNRPGISHVKLLVGDFTKSPIGIFDLTYDDNKISIYNGYILGCISLFVYVYQLLNDKEVE